MEETTAATNGEIAINKETIDGVFETLLKVFDFFKGIVDMLAGLIQPVFEDVFKSILG